MSNFLIVIALALFAAPNARANSANGWIEVGCTSQDECNQVKEVSRRDPFVTFERKTVGTKIVFTQVADCQKYKYRTIAIDGKGFVRGWRDTVPGSLGESIVTTVCQS